MGDQSVKHIDLLRRFQSNEEVFVLDRKDAMELLMEYGTALQSNVSAQQAVIAGIKATKSLITAIDQSTTLEQIREGIEHCRPAVEELAKLLPEN